MDKIQIISIVVSIIYFILIIELIRRKKMLEQYSLLWLFWGIVFLLLSIFRQLLDLLANALGIYDAPNAIFLILIVALFMILIQYSIIISRLAIRNNKLAQEIGILRCELEKLYQNVDNKKEVKI